MAAKKRRRGRRRKSDAQTTATAGVAAGGRQIEHTAVWEDGAAREVGRVVDVIDQMYRQGTLDGREYQAATKYRADYEMLFSGYRCPLDQTPVGGGGIASPTAAQVEAAARLQEASALLGMLDGCVVMMVAGEGLNTVEAARRLLAGHEPSRRDALEVGRRLSNGLRQLADVWFPVRDRGEITAARRFDPMALNTAATEVVRGVFVHVTRSGIYRNAG